MVERRPLQQRDKRGHEENKRQHAVVEREDAQDTPHIEVAEVVRFVVSIVQNTCDQEAGQDKEILLPAGQMPLNNGGDEIELLDANGNQIDFVSYTGDQVSSGEEVMFDL